MNTKINLRARKYLSGIMLISMVLSVCFGIGNSNTVKASDGIIPESETPSLSEGVIPEREMPSLSEGVIPPGTLEREIAIQIAQMERDQLLLERQKIHQSLSKYLEQTSAGSTGSETIYVFKPWNEVDLENWTANTQVTITVDDPGTGTNPDISKNVVVDSDGWGYSYFNEITLFQPGFVVTASDGGITKTHTVTSLQITNIDSTLDRVVGTAGGSSVIDLQACNATTCEYLTVTAGPGGFWTANFSGILDIQAGDYVFASDHTGDSDGDTTVYYDYVPNPRFSVTPAIDYVSAYEWISESAITATVDDPGTGISPDDTLTLTADLGGSAQFLFEGRIDILPGFTITVTDGSTTRSHIVTSLEVTEVDRLTEVVTGKADAGISVDIRVCSSGCYSISVIPDAGGNWQANFSGNLDILPGARVYAYQYDPDGDWTRAFLIIPNPHIVVFPDRDGVFNAEWIPGTELTIQVDDPGTGTNPDETQTGTVEPSGYVEFDFTGIIDIQAGFIITVSDGDTTKVHTVTPLQITDIDVDLDLVTGVAAPDSTLEIYGCTDPNCYWIYPTADSGGNWQADFFGYIDIMTGSSGLAWQVDEDGDQTNIEWRIWDKRFGVYPRSNEIHVDEWVPGMDITVEVDDPATGLSPDASQSATINRYGQIQVSFGGIIDLQPGFVVTVFDADTTKVHTVTPVEITGADIGLDIATGTADPDSWLLVEVCDTSIWSCYEMSLYADSIGNWEADFSGLFDIVIGTLINATQWDEDNDFTRFNQYVPFGDGIISGVVNAPDGNPVTGVAVQVEVYLKVDGFWVGSTYTDPADGTFVVSGLPEDMELAVRASGEDPDVDGFADEFYDNTNFDFAASIILTASDLEWDGIVINLDFLHDWATEEQLTFNTRSGRILADVDIRKAIAYGTNRQEIIEEGFQPYGTTGQILNTLVYPGSWFEAPASDPLLTVYEYNPATAIALLEGAGWFDTDLDGIREKSGIDLALDYKTTTAVVRQASGSLFKSQMAAIGIQINDFYIPAYIFFSDDPAVSPLLSGDFDIAHFAWVAQDIDQLIGVYNTGHGQNHGGYSNPILDGYYAAAKAGKESLDNPTFLANALNWQYEYSADLPSLPLLMRVPMPRISGTIYDEGGAPLTGVSVELNVLDDVGTLLTTWYTNPDDASYNIPVLPNFSGSIVPSLAGYVFDPENKEYTNVTADISGEDYTAIPLPLLTVTKTGTGAGWVGSTPGGISCGTDCSESYAPGTSVKLTATASPGSAFIGWSGACGGASSTCYVSMTKAKNVTANFLLNPAGQYYLSVAKTGSGSVTSSPIGIICPTDCGEFYNSGTAVTLTATASAGYLFTGWSGACGGTTSTCIVPMSKNKSVTATFLLIPAGKYYLGVKKSGSGMVESFNVPGISCGTDCSEFYTFPLTVRLKATPAVGYQVTWSGACGGTVLNCYVNLTTHKFVKATFTLIAGLQGDTSPEAFLPAWLDLIAWDPMEAWRLFE